MTIAVLLVTLPTGVVIDVLVGLPRTLAKVSGRENPSENNSEERMKSKRLFLYGFARGALVNGINLLVPTLNQFDNYMRTGRKGVSHESSLAAW